MKLLADAVDQTFGKIKPPDAFQGLIEKNSSGSFAISTILSNLISLIYILASIVNATAALAQTPKPTQDPNGRTIIINRPKRANNENLCFSTICDFIQKVLTLAFIIAVIVVLFMLVWGAFEWITSGGDKEAVG